MHKGYSDLIKTMKNPMPYHFRAMLDWIADSGCTPMISVDGNFEDCVVPMNHANEEGFVHLNISGSATMQYKMTDTEITFYSGVDGRDFFSSIPLDAVRAVYARENSAGMMFQPQRTINSSSEPNSTPQSAHQAPTKRPNGPPKLSIVKP